MWDRAVSRTTRTYDFRKSQVKANHGQFPAFTDCARSGGEGDRASKPSNLTTFFVAGETLRGTF
jgi:hypothetical protein